MPTQKRKSPSKITRSTRLRKYEAAYDICVKNTKKPPGSPRKRSPHKKTQPKKVQRSPSPKKRSPNTKLPVKTGVPKRKSPVKVQCKPPAVKPPARKQSKTRKRPLNAYQMFVRTESTKEKYAGLAATERMRHISQAWNAKK